MLGGLFKSVSYNLRASVFMHVLILVVSDREWYRRLYDPPVPCYFSLACDLAVVTRIVSRGTVAGKADL